MSVDPFERRYRLRRLSFPLIRPRQAPHGFVLAVGWLARGVLWIDGWLTLSPTKEVDLLVNIDGRQIHGTATCIPGPVFKESEGNAARRWLMLMSVDEPFLTASRVRDIALFTHAGLLCWTGGKGRLISADLLLRGSSWPGEILQQLDSHLTRARKVGRVTKEDPVFQRNAAILRRWVECPDSKTHGIDRPPGETAVEEISLRFGDPVDQPSVSLIIPILAAPDLLEHHFAHLLQSRGLDDWELILVVTSPGRTPGLGDRVKNLEALYRIGVRLVCSDLSLSWAEAVTLGARHACGEHLVFLGCHILPKAPDALASLVSPLRGDRSTGITTPVIENFDGSVRSQGLEVALVPGAAESLRFSAQVSPTHLPANVEADVDACGSCCLAIQASLFQDLGLAGVFHRPDFETVDLCLRARTRDAGVLRVPARFTHLVELAAPPPLPATIPSDDWDQFLAGRRLRLYGSGGARSALQFGEGHSYRNSATPVATVVLPTLNPGRELADVLDRLQGQKGCPPFEILVIDSSSRDGTIGLLRRRGIRHVVIDRAEFNHGLTRNQGLREARGEIVAFLSQDALPTPGWLAGLLAAFQDPNVAGAYSRQQPRSDASLFVRDQLARWPASGEEPRRQKISNPCCFAARPLLEQLAALCFDNVSSAVRREIALEIPFRSLAFGEDRDWSYRVQAAGHSVRFCPDSVVLHSHERSIWYQLQRTYVDHRLILETLGYPEHMAPPAFFPTWGAEVSRLMDVASAAPSLWRRLWGRLAAPSRALASVGGGYLALRIDPQALGESRPSRWLHRRLAKGL